MKLGKRLRLAAVLVTVVALGNLGCNRPSSISNPKQIELTVVDYAKLDSGTIRAINEEFTRRHPGVTIHMKDRRQVPMPWPSAGGGKIPGFDGIDIVLFNPGAVRAQAAFGTIKEIPPANIPALNEYAAPVFHDLVTVEEKQYGLPFWIAPSLVGVNETPLTKAGISIPPVDWTWADFSQAAVLAKKAGLQSDIYVANWLEPIVRANGGLLFDPNTQTWGWETPAVQQGLQTMAELVQQGGFNPEASDLDAKTAPEEAAFVHYYDRVYPYPGVVLRPFPKGPAGRPVAAQAYVGAVPSTTEQADLALEYIRSLLSPTAQMAMARSGLRPVTADEPALNAWRETVGAEAAEATELGMADLYAVTDYTTTAQNSSMLTELLPYFTGQTSLEAATANLKSKISTR